MLIRIRHEHEHRYPQVERERLLERLLESQEKIMSDLSKLNSTTAKLSTDVDALIASQTSDQPAIDAATAAVQAVDDKVIAATPPPTT